MRILPFLLFAAFLTGCIYLSDFEPNIKPIGAGETQVDDNSSDTQGQLNALSSVSSASGKPVFSHYTEDFSVNLSKTVDKFELRPASLLFKSKFFAGDSTGEKIITGELTNYPISDFQAVNPNNRNTFAFKILNAMRILGYSPGCGRGYADCYGRFLRDQNLPETELVTNQALVKIDALIANKENEDAEIARGFTNYADFVELNVEGEPSKNHLVALFAKLFKLLPMHLQPNKEGVRAFFYYQLSDGASGNESIKCNEQKQCEVTFTTYYNSLTNRSDKNNVFLIGNDHAQTSVALHEYGHYLDSNVYQRNEELNAGIVNTTEFYSFTYDLSSEYKHEIGWSYFKPRENFAGREKEFFISSYAVGVQRDDLPGYYTAYEDFAESFSGYIFAGNIFRCKAEKYPGLALKYAWLKQNVFNGIEYNTEKAVNCDEFYSHPEQHIFENPNFTKFEFNDIQKLN